MAPGDWPSIPAVFFDWAGRKGSAPFLWGKRDGIFVATTWAEAAGIVRALAGGLRALGIVPGDRVAIVMENRPEWVLADFAIMAAGAITVPAYTTYTAEDYRHVLADSGAKALIIGTGGLVSRVLPAADQLPLLTAIVSLEPVRRQTGADTYLWDQVLELGAPEAAAIEQSVAALAPDDTACLIYTSGTGGVPKGVMVTHRNMLSNAAGARKVFESAYRLGDESFLSFLPLTHAYEHTAGVVFPLLIGAETYFTTPDSLAGDMPQVRPTIMTAVPRLCETLQKRITQTALRGSWPKRTLFQLTLHLGARAYRGHGQRNPIERGLNRLLDRLVRHKIGQRFGGRLKAFVSGGAALSEETGLFFVALGVKLIQGYGQTETGPVIAVNSPVRLRIDSVGQPLDGVTVRIAEDGEVLVRGPNVMKGYWRDPEATARAIRDGWLHTGDVGQMDRDGFLRITDRKRDFIKNTGGEMISPQRIEGMLTQQPGVAQAMAYGDGKPYLVALLVPDEATDAALSRSEIQQRLADAVAQVNRNLTGIERIRRFLIADEAFTVANGMMTPTLKIKRHIIRQHYGEALDRLYDGRA